MNLCNTALGVSVLLTPQMMARNGWLLGTLIMVVGVLVAVGTLRILAVAAFLTGMTTYQDVLSRAVHRRCAKALNVTMSLHALVSCASQLTLVADQVLAISHADSWCNRMGLITLVAVAEVPLMLLRDISLFQGTSALGVFTNCVVVIVIMFYCSQRLLSDGMHPDIVAVKGHVDTAVSAFGLSTFGFGCHTVLVPVIGSMGRQSTRGVDCMIVACTSLCFSVYVACGLLGYFAYGEGVDSSGGDILANNLPHDAWTNAARVCLALKTAVAYPLLHFPARLCLGDLWVDGDVLERRYRTQFYATTAFFLGTTWALAVFVSNLSVLVDLTAMLFAVFQFIIWPGLLCWVLSSEAPPLRRWPGCAAGCALILLGLAMACFGVYNQIKLSMGGNHGTVQVVRPMRSGY